MNPYPELVALIQRERELDIEHDRLGRIAACARACCRPSLVDRLARVLRPATYLLRGLRDDRPSRSTRKSAPATPRPASKRTTGGCCSGEPETIGAGLYSALEHAELPDAAVLASLGCGNPIAVAELHEGERVLDLGSGGGIDVLLSASASARPAVRSGST